MFPAICKRAFGVVVPIPTLSPVFAKKTFVEERFQEEELNKLSIEESKSVICEEGIVMFVQSKLANLVKFNIQFPVLFTG